MRRPDPTPRPRVVMVDGVPMSGTRRRGPAEPRAVIVAIHGGATPVGVLRLPGPSRGCRCCGWGRIARLHGDRSRPARLRELRAVPGRDGASRPAGRAGATASSTRSSAERPRRRALPDRPLGGMRTGGTHAGWRADERAGTGLLGVELAGTGVQYDASATAEIMQGRRPTSHARRACGICCGSPPNCTRPRC